MLVAEGNRLQIGRVGGGDVGRAVDHDHHPRQQRKDQQRAENADLGERVETAMKYLRHRPTRHCVATVTNTSLWIPTPAKIAPPRPARSPPRFATAANTLTRERLVAKIPPQ